MKISVTHFKKEEVVLDAKTGESFLRVESVSVDGVKSVDWYHYVDNVSVSDRKARTLEEAYKPYESEIDLLVVELCRERMEPLVGKKFLEEADFEHKGKVHEWKNYVDSTYIKMWHKLTYREKAMIYLEAKYQADREEWN